MDVSQGAEVYDCMNLKALWPSAIGIGEQSLLLLAPPHIYNISG